MQELLKINYIKKRYGTTQVLNGINLTIYKGEIVSLLGINGAGKTTLSSIIATSHPASEGDITYKGNSIYNNLIHYRSRIGYCPQKPNLNPFLTLKQNLIFAGALYGMKEEAIQNRLHILVNRFGLAAYLNQKASVLSGGYKQRFMIARSLMHQPEFIIFDEPTVGLDPHIRRGVWEVIKELKQEGMTVLLTTHYLDEAEKLSDRVCILDKGHIKLIDTPDKLMADFKQKNLEDVFIALLQANQE
ncbi:MAG TPA: ABC transporter ATP-binding protein [Candidatus Babeliales bacterium]|jgi:ABC-2 type transport system ATP-binding protein|nr:ABC transporter ATP-binding protein [Candidatus Babeliales bacterium]